MKLLVRSKVQKFMVLFRPFRIHERILGYVLVLLSRFSIELEGEFFSSEKI